MRIGGPRREIMLRGLWTVTARSVHSPPERPGQRLCHGSRHPQACGRVLIEAGIYRKAVITNPAGPFLLLYHDEFYRYEQGFLIKWPPWAELRGIPAAALGQLRRLPIRR